MERRSNRRLQFACSWVYTGIVLLVLFFPSALYSQCLSRQQFYEKIFAIKNDKRLSNDKRLAEFQALKQNVDACRLPRDSVYALLLHRLGLSCFVLHKYNEAIGYTLSSIRLNTARTSASNPRFAVNSYYNTGLYFRELNRDNDALTYFDSCTLAAQDFKDSLTLFYVANARGAKADLYIKNGDYQKVIEEATIGLRSATLIRNSAIAITLLNERARAYANLQLFAQAMTDLNEAAKLMNIQDVQQMADNYKYKATVSSLARRYDEAITYYKKTIAVRTKTHDTAVLAGDFLECGNTERDKVISKGGSDFSTAVNNYAQALRLAKKVSSVEMQVKATNNLAAIAFRKKNYAEALNGYHNSLQQVIIALKDADPLRCPTYRQCDAISDKKFLSLLLSNKAECLLYLYKQTGNKAYLDASLRTALLTDSIITDMRHEQSGEQIKLYWREQTRWFFINAVEASYSANDPAAAFYFMEKSRAVLLNDRLNELGAAVRLPATEAAEEQRRQIDVFTQQQKLSGLQTDSPAYAEEEARLFAAKEAFRQYVSGLQKKFPAYYQYKYADASPSLPQLQSHLAANKQSFVDYFISDTAVYTLLVTPSSASIKKQKKEKLADEFLQFLQTCSDPQRLNNDYSGFAAQAYSLYQILIRPLALPKGRVIVCSDGLVIPFEALTTDAEGKNFLVNDYSFSYVYSAQALLKRFNNPSGDGNFLGIAPGRYAARLSVPPLQGALASMQTSSGFYGSHKLLPGNGASRNNLLRYLPRYNVVAILSHARADSTDKEPVLFLADSVIHLSELQLLLHPSTQLVVLSACQTNVGKLAPGEGVFSLTRGFASAGVPSITATLWKADEEAVYAITQIFLKDIAAGMNKDEALRQAKLAFMQSGNRARLPYYWANMVLAGNSEPVALQIKSFWGWWLCIAVVAALFAAWLFLRREKKVSLNALASNKTQ